MVDLVLTPAESRVAEGLVLTPRKTFCGTAHGERPTNKKGVSIDFADYREYSDGDDLRHLDWNVLARLDSAIVKTYRNEQDLTVYLGLDTSASMSFGEPNKLAFARRVACALGLSALRGGDSVTPLDLGQRPSPATALRGHSAYPRLARWAVGRVAAKGTGLAESVRLHTQVLKRPGVLVVVSDCLDPEIVPALQLAAGRGHELYVVQTLGREDTEPDLEGDLRLVDADGCGPEVETTASAGVVEQYKVNLWNHVEVVGAAVRKSGGRHAWVPTDQVLTQFLTHQMLREGWVA